MSELSDLLLANLPEGWSRRQVAREAQKQGLHLSEATATAYFAGRHGVPDDATLHAFSVVLKIPERRMRAVAGLSAVGSVWTPPHSSRYLRDDQRAALEQLISTMVERRQEGGGRDDDSGSSAATKAADGDRDNNPDDGDEGGGSVINLPAPPKPPASPARKVARKSKQRPALDVERERQDEDATRPDGDGSDDPA